MVTTSGFGSRSGCDSGSQDGTNGDNDRLHVRSVVVFDVKEGIGLMISKSALDRNEEETRKSDC